MQPAYANEERSLLDQLAELVDEIAGLAGTGCLVESSIGRLLAHRVTTEAPLTVLQALASGETGPLHAALTDRRTTGLVGSLPVIESLLDGARIAQVGPIWLLLKDSRPTPLHLITEPLNRLRVLLSYRAEEHDSLRACMFGTGDLPFALRSAERLWLALTDDPGLLLKDLPSCATALSDGRYVVIGTPRSTTLDQVRQALSLALAGSAAGAVVTGVGEDLPSARVRLEAAADAWRPGRCSLLTELRSAVVTRQLAAALHDLPDLGPHPVQALLDYDSERASQLVETLRCWLDEFGDVAAIRESLGIHTNTLRYRMKRIREITGIDFEHDPQSRLEAHLRLLST